MEERLRQAEEAERLGNLSLAESSYRELGRGCGHPRPWLSLIRVLLASQQPDKFHEAASLLSSVQDFAGFEQDRESGALFFVLRASVALIQSRLSAAAADAQWARQHFGVFTEPTAVLLGRIEAEVSRLTALANQTLQHAVAAESRRDALNALHFYQQVLVHHNDHPHSQGIQRKMHEIQSGLAVTAQARNPPQLPFQPLRPASQWGQAGQSVTSGVASLTFEDSRPGSAFASVSSPGPPAAAIAGQAQSSNVPPHAQRLLDFLTLESAELKPILAAQPDLDLMSAIFAGLARKSREQTYLEFKKSFTKEWKDKLPRWLVSMYNGVMGTCYPALSKEESYSAYLLFGVFELPGSHAHTFHPVFHVDGNTITTTIGGKTQPKLPFHLHPVTFRRDLDIGGGHGRIMAGQYLLVEVLLARQGPARFLDRQDVGSSSTRPGSELQAEWMLAMRRGETTFSDTDILKDPILWHQLYKRFDQICWGNGDLDAAEETLRLKDDRLKILVIGEASGQDDSEQLNDLHRALGRGHFQMVINLDQTPRLNNHRLRALEAGLEAKSIPKQFVDWRELTEPSRIPSLSQDLWFSKKTLIIQPDPNLADKMIAKEFAGFMDKIFSRHAAKNRTPLFVACFTAMRKDLLVHRLMTVVKDCFQDSTPDEQLAASDAELPISIMLCSEPSELFAEASDRRAAAAPDSVAVEENQRRQWLYGFTTLAQLSSRMKNLYGQGQELGQTYRLPGSSGPVDVAVRRFLPFESEVSLMHEDAGLRALKDHSLNRDQLMDYLSGERLKFALGMELTLDGLLAHDQLHQRSELGVYIHRKEFDELLGRVRKALEMVHSSRFGFRENMVTPQEKTQLFHHEPSAGGTTVALVTLWQLRKEYPCLVINGELNETVADAIRFVEKETKKTVLVLMDSSRITETDAFKFHFRVGVHMVVLHVSSVEKAGKGQLSLALSTIENQAWNNFYNDYIQDAKDRKWLDSFQLDYLKDDHCTKSAFLFGLMSFMEEFRRLPQIAQKLVQMAPVGAPRTLLLLAAYLRQNAGKHGLNSAIANTCLGLSVSQENDRRVLDKLGVSRSLLISTKSRRGADWGLVVPTQPLAKAVLEAFEDLAECKPSLVNSVIQLIIGLSSRYPDIAVHLERYVMNLFKHKKTVTLPSGASRRGKHCELVLQVFAEFKPLMAAGKLDELARAFGGDCGMHIQAHIARYLAYTHKAEHFAEAIRYINKALGLDSREGLEDPLHEDYSQTGVTTHLILCIAVHILFCYIEQKVGSFERKVALLKPVSILCERAKSDKNDSQRACHPYITEISYLYMLQLEFFGKNCGDNAEAYFAALGSKKYPSEAGIRHEELLAKIMELEYLHQAGRLQAAELREKEVKDLEHIKRWFRGLYLSMGKAFGTKQYSDLIRHPKVLAWLIVDLMWQKTDPDRFVHRHQKLRKVDSAMEYDIETGVEVGELAKGDRLSFWHTARFIERLSPDELDQASQILSEAKAHLQRRNRFELICLTMARQRLDTAHVKRYEEAMAEAEAWAKDMDWDVLPAFLFGALALALCLHRRLQLDAKDSDVSLKSQQDDLRRTQAKYFTAQRMVEERLKSRTARGPNAPRFLVQGMKQKNRTLIRLYPVGPAEPIEADRHRKSELTLSGSCVARYWLDCDLLRRATESGDRLNAPTLEATADVEGRAEKLFGLCLAYAGPKAINIRDPPPSTDP